MAQPFEVRKSVIHIADVRDADSYSMYERDGVWYVDFRINGRRKRRSTYARTEIDARAAVESFRENRPASRTIPDDEFLRRALERARYRAHKKGVPFGLTMERMREMYERSGGRCAVTGHVLEKTGPFRPSLDRVDPELGYVDGNVRVVCLITNTAMLHYGESALLELAASIVQHRNLLPGA